jgi:DNA-binding NarL/FixJ family response regulator
MLAEDPDIEIVSDVGTAEEALAEVRRLRPRVLVLDIGLPDRAGTSIIGEVLAASPGTGVLILTMHDDVAYLRKAFAAGALGYVLKAAADVELMQAVHEVAGGRRYVHPALGAALIGGTPASGGHRGVASLALSDREEEILRLVALGYTNTEMAEKMILSVRTVETHRLRLQQKVGLRTRAELARLARDSGLLG